MHKTMGLRPPSCVSPDWRGKNKTQKKAQLLAGVKLMAMVHGCLVMILSYGY